MDDWKDEDYCDGSKRINEPEVLWSYSGDYPGQWKLSGEKE